MLVRKLMTSAVRSRISGDYLVACKAEAYDSLFREKQERLRGLLSWTGPIEAFESPKQHFRFRANFQMWHDNMQNRTPEGFYYTMYDEKDPKLPREITSYPPGTERLNELMQNLRPFFSNPLIFNSLFEVRFITTKVDPEQCIILLCYKRPLPATWLDAAREIATSLRCKVIGRARKEMKFVGGTFDDEFIQEVLEVEGHKIKLFQTEGAFSQPNAYVAEKMIAWAMDTTRPGVATGPDEDLLELYCGGGTFTAPLSFNFRRVLATEVSSASVALAKRCFEANELSQKIMVARMSSEEFSAWYREDVLQTTRTDTTTVQTKKARREMTAELSRLQLTAVSDLNLTTVFVDPPRAGVDADTCNLLSLFPKIVYISCNPETLARDVKMLQSTHDIVRVAAFDQFPYTHHLESGVYMVKRASSDSEPVLGKRTREEEEGDAADAQAAKK